MSHIARLFVEPDLIEDQAIDLPEAQSKYLIRVMRLTDGARVRAFNGRDGEWACTLQVEGKRARLVPSACLRAQAAGPDLTLMFAPIKKARTDFIIEKATELGVRRIQPVYTEYTQTQRVRIDRFHALAIEAAEQTERLDLPQIEEAATLSACLADWPSECPLIFCDESADAAPLASYAAELKDKAAAILIGPEGGFSPRERQMLRGLPFVRAITLGPRILRAETAAVAAITLWQSMVGDWEKPPYLPQT